MTKKIYLQAGFWSIILVINLALVQGGRHPGRDALFELISIVFYALAFYVNIFWLFPRYYDRTKAGYFAGSFLLLAGIFLLIHALGREIFGGGDRGHHREFLAFIFLFRQAFWLVLIYMIATVYSIQEKLNQQITHNKIVIEEKLQTELQLLKAQINPHFLFNALNNVYSLTYMKSDKASESVLKLSEMLRYVLEDCNAEKVPLRNEVEYLENLLEFYKMKSPGKRKVTFTHEIEDLGKPIAPMLFMPFIENSFKYSRIEEDKNGFIEVDLREASGILHFIARNSVFQERPILKGSGKGIANVKHRLNIIYPGKHTLVLSEKDHVFLAELEIMLK